VFVDSTDAVLAGCAGFIGMCDFKCSNSATKEMLDILKAVLPGEQVHCKRFGVKCGWHS
jgi:predicted small metal-binding protein